ncbi:hypothetical protein WME90_43365 [Sorangium sp. So ce375]|uniref:hypothetical protein n=1 Tax=Sorangium sp. So ce375 TaxID=3133306 RepID=UPI003F5C57B1
MASRRRARLDAALRVLAALIGTLPLAVLGSVCLARFAPFGEATRSAVGFSLVVPLWLAAMCVAFLARSAARAWGGCAALGAVLLALAYWVPQ